MEICLRIQLIAGALQGSSEVATVPEPESRSPPSSTGREPSQMRRGERVGEDLNKYTGRVRCRLGGSNKVEIAGSRYRKSNLRVSLPLAGKETLQRVGLALVREHLLVDGPFVVMWYRGCIVLMPSICVSK